MLKAGWMPPDKDGNKQGVDDLIAKGASIEDIEHYLKPYTGVEFPVEGWPVLANEANYGLPGKIVKEILPHTEADAPALLFSLLVYAGCMIGRNAHFQVEGDRHYLKNFAVIVGSTSKGRKGVSQGRIDTLMKEVNPDFMDTNTSTGLSSGEGLIMHVRDQMTKVNRQTGDIEVVDEGVADKGLLVTEPEFASTLTVMSREGNTLSMVLRNAWDDRPLKTMTKQAPLKATDTHISIIGHVTQNELKRHLTEDKLGAGIANRFLFCMADRSKVLPHGGNPRPVLPGTVRALKEAIRYAQGVGEVPLGYEESEEYGHSARELWEEVYPSLSEGADGLFGSVTSRAEAHTRRVATLYAVLDKSPTVGVEHLYAGLAVWQYAEDSAMYLFGDKRGDPIEDTILEELRLRGYEGMTKTQISDLFGRNYPAQKINAALENLLEAGLIKVRKERTGEKGPKTNRFYIND